MSAHHTSPLRPHGEDLLKAALSDPFSVPPDIPRVSPTQPASQSQSLPPPPAAAAAAAGPSPLDVPPPSDPSAPASATSEPTSSSWSSLPVSPAEQEAHRAEYEANVVEWRRQSADVRTHAEAERARWAERRAREREEQLARGTGVSASGESVGASASASEWEAVSSVATQQSASVLPPSTSTSTSTTDPEPRGRSGAPAHLQSRQGSHTQNLPQSASSNAPPTRPAPTDSPQWENVLTSPTSSFPSMSFPEPSRPHSPEHPLQGSRAAATTTTVARPATATAAVTLAVFDPALPPRTRIWALFSSLSINMFLPFVNGVMLGFGEIFAKTVIVGWLGWGPKVATNVGLGVPSRNRS